MKIAKLADINIGSLMHLFKAKEDILADLVKYVLESRFKVATDLLKCKNEDKILFYSAETTLRKYSGVRQNYERLSVNTV